MTYFITGATWILGGHVARQVAAAGLRRRQRRGTPPPQMQAPHG